MDEVVWKQIGYTLVGILGFLGTGIVEWINALGISPFWIVSLVGCWYILDAFLLFYIHYIFKLPQTEQDNNLATATESSPP